MTKKKAKTKTALAPVRELLPTPEEVENMPTFAVSALFQFKELKLKDDLAWRIKLVVKKQLPQTFREYDASLSLNEIPYEIRIADMEKRKFAISEEPTLFAGEKEKQIRGCDLEIGDIERELEQARRDTPTMEFKAIIEQLTYTDGDTILVMIVSSEVVGQINSNRHILENYKLDLIRE